MTFSANDILILVVVLAAALAFFFLLKRYFIMRDKIRMERGSVSAKDFGEIDVDDAGKMSEVLGAGDMSDGARSALTTLCRKGLSREMKTVFDEIDKKVKTVVEAKDLQYNQINEKYSKTLIEKKQTESVIKSIAEGLVVLNDRDEVIMMNPAAEKILDISMADQIGKPVRSLVKDEHLMSLATGKGSPEDTEVELNAGSENAKKVLRSSSAVIQNESGRTVGMVSVFTDVTKQREVEDLKSQFISNVSHELRTPLVAVRNSIVIILNEKTGSLTEDQKKYLLIAERNIKQLSRFVDDLLDVSKMEAKKMELHPAPASTEVIINEVCETLEAWAQTKNISIVRNVQSNIPDIKMEKERIVQVLINLIGNAIKFTPTGGIITVEAKLKTEEKGNLLLVRIIDTGPGITKENISKLFNKFRQVGGKNPNDKSGGTGLGLYISKELIELHGGTIYVESTPGEGAMFAFTLPIT